MAQKDEYQPLPKGYTTTAIHHAQEADQWDSMSLVPPIIMSSTYQYLTPESSKKYEYGRRGNPTRDVLESVLAKLEDAKYSLTFASGLGAVTAMLGLLNSGDHLISAGNIYGGTHELFANIATKFGIEVTFLDIVDPPSLEANTKKNTKLVFIETPSNPMMQITDIEAVSKAIKKHNIILVLDNTFLTSYLLRSLPLGVDIAFYSLTKYMNGHTDVIMGALVTSNPKLYKELKYMQNIMGIIPSPFDCYLVNRSLKTLPLRLKQHNHNALTIAKYLENHPKIDKVLHPGLPSHPQHELFKKQTGGHSGTFSFYLKGTLETSNKLLTSLKFFVLAPSVGSYKSLIELPSTMSHIGVPLEERLKIGITDTLIRVSVGIEDTEDLIADLEQALNAL